jgi:hypothetical protein
LVRLMTWRLPSFGQPAQLFGTSQILPPQPKLPLISLDNWTFAEGY